MSWTDIEDGEPGNSVRAKINNAFQALFGASPTSLWEVISGSGHIKPKDNRPVDVTELEADEITTEELHAGSSSQVQVINDKLRLPYLGGFEGSSMPLIIDAEGYVQTDEEQEGDAPVGRGVMFTQYGYGVSVNFDPLRPTILVIKDENFDIQMPAAADQNNVEAVVRKCSDNTYAVTINTIGGETRWDDKIGNGLTTTEMGAWVRLKSVRVSEILQYWVVVEIGGEWTIILP